VPLAVGDDVYQDVPLRVFDKLFTGAKADEKEERYENRQAFHDWTWIWKLILQIYLILSISLIFYILIFVHLAIPYAEEKNIFYRG
jgi:hypothetical protein